MAMAQAKKILYAAAKAFFRDPLLLIYSKILIKSAYFPAENDVITVV
jgi:hypothetical protein